mmetsp:Transcript_111512/g.355909  ORF Transcript_111512/g.355909 Transcript_111512/m.355909 type:complete len:253 (-) Transcript_111512:88-846(-)
MRARTVRQLQSDKRRAPCAPQALQEVHVGHRSHADPVNEDCRQDCWVRLGGPGHPVADPALRRGQPAPTVAQCREDGVGQEPQPSEGELDGQRLVDDLQRRGAEGDRSLRRRRPRGRWRRRELLLPAHRRCDLRQEVMLLRRRSRQAEHLVGSSVEVLPTQRRPWRLEPLADVLFVQVALHGVLGEGHGADGLLHGAQEPPQVLWRAPAVCAPRQREPREARAEAPVGDELADQVREQSVPPPRATSASNQP